MVVRKHKKHASTVKQHGRRHRGSGNRGGVGRAGGGKRGKQKKQMFFELGKVGLKPKDIRLRAVSLSQLPEGDMVDLGRVKLLGSGFINHKVHISCFKATKRAVEKVERAGGKVEVK